MFGKKKKDWEFDEEKIKCAYCRHSVERGDCKRVEIEEEMVWSYGGKIYYHYEDYYYCRLCTPEWDRKDKDGNLLVRVPETYNKINEKKSTKKKRKK